MILLLNARSNKIKLQTKLVNRFRIQSLYPTKMKGTFPYNYKTMMNILRPQKYIPAVFALITLIAYGLLLPFTGFYWDDWPFAWIAKFLGPSEFIPAFAPFRPFLGPIFYFTTSLIPPVPLVLADLCARYPFYHRHFSMVDVQTDMARTPAHCAYRRVLHSYLSGLQSALGCVHTHQPGTHPFYFLSALIRLHLQSSAIRKTHHLHHHRVASATLRTSSPQNIFSASKACASSFYSSSFKAT